MSMVFNSEKIEKYSSILADEYKEMLVKETMIRTGTDSDVGVKVLLDLDTEAKRTLVATSLKMKKKQKFIAMVGLIYIFVGFFMVLWYFIKKSGVIYEDDGTILLMALVVSFVGMLVVMFSAVLRLNNDINSILIKSKSEESRILSYSVIEKWRELDSIISELSGKNSFVAPKTVIRYLQENDLIDSKEENDLRKFLIIRNNIIHFPDKKVQSSDVKESIEKIEKIISKLEKIL